MLTIFTVDTNLDVVNASDGVMSLREAINSANAMPDDDMIDFDPVLFGATIQLQAGSPLVITNDLMIAGLGADELTIRGSGSSVFVVGDNDFVGAPKSVTIARLTITGGSASFGAGVQTTENLTLEDCVVTGNVATSMTTLGVGSYGGAGVWSSSSFGGGATPITTSIVRCEISNNEVLAIPDGGAANPSLPGFNGGGIFSRDNLVVIDSFITNNRAGQGSPGFNNSPAGAGGDGGGIYSMGATTIQGTTISGNHAGRGSDAPTVAFTRDAGAGGNGGGLAVVGSLTITDSVIAGNFAGAGGLSANGSSGDGGSGGGVHFTSVANGALTIDRTTIGSNMAGHGVSGGGAGRASSDGGDGGGVWASGLVAIANSTISSNSAGNGGAARVAAPVVNHAGDGGDGGGLWLIGAGIKGLTNTTVSTNSSGRGGASVAGAASGDGGHGGGVWIGGTGAVTIGLSTIVNNIAGDSGANVAGGLGGGIRGTGGGAHHVGTVPSVQVNNSIVAQNVRGVSAPVEANDLAGPGSFAVRYSLIGVNTGAIIANNGGNKIGTAGSPFDPFILPLADNGGVTFTHALDLISPAVNAGDPALIAGAGGTPANDQRGTPFNRVIGGRIDMGSFELEDAPTPADTDFDNDGDTDGSDFLLWQRGNGDATGNGTSDGDDLALWRQNFGSALVATNATVYVAASEAHLAAAENHTAETVENPSLDMLTGVGGYAIEQRGRDTRSARPVVSVEAPPKAIGPARAAGDGLEQATLAKKAMPRREWTAEVDSLDAAFEEFALAFGRHGM